MKTTTSLGGDHIRGVAAARDAFLDHLRLGGAAEGTLQVHWNALSQFGKFWGDRDLREATERDLEAYAKATLGRVARESAYVYLNSVRMLLRFLVEQSVLLVDPARAIPMPRMRDRMTGRILSAEEMSRLIEAVDVGSPIGLRDRAMLEFLYSTGLRASECRRVGVVDLGVDAVTVREGKGGKDRVVPVGVSALRWIRRYLAEARPGFAAYHPEVEALWLTRWGKPFGETLFQQHLRKLGASAGIEGLTCHMIRRSMATGLLRAGASPQEVSGILGHSDLKSLSRYVQVVAREVKETHEKTHPRETT